MVVTSSGGAVISFPPPSEGYVYTEKDWNTQSSLMNNPYFYSKRLAEQAAWRLWEEHKDKLDLVVVNPSFVIGPPQSPILNTSLKTVLNYLTGKLEKPLPGHVSFVDVRDVALGHVIALEKDDAIGRRHVTRPLLTAGHVSVPRAPLLTPSFSPASRLFCCAQTRTWRDMAARLKEFFPQFPNVSDLDVDVGVESHMDTSLIKVCLSASSAGEECR